jgi:hypothetical protein
VGVELRERLAGAASASLRAALAAVFVVVAASSPGETGEAPMIMPGGRFTWTHVADGSHPAISAPAVAVRPDDTPLLAWSAGHGEAGKGGVSVWVAAPSDPRATPARVNPDDLAAESIHQAPGIASGPGGEVFVSWSSVKSKPEGVLFASDLRVSRSSDGGRTFGPPVRVNDDRAISHSFEGMARTSNGALLVAWIDSREGWQKAGTYVARLVDDGTRVDATSQIGAETCVCCRVAVAAGGEDRAVVLWRKDFPGQVRDMVIASSKDDGRTFSTAARVHEDDWKMPACPHRGGGVAIDAKGRSYVAWYTEGENERPGIYFARADSDGGVVSKPVRIDESIASIPDHVRVAVDAKGTILVVWEDSTAVRRRILARASIDGGATFSPPQALSTAMKAHSPALAARRNGFVVAWQEEEFPAFKTVAQDVRIKG